MKILVVEDNIKILKSICDELDNHLIHINVAMEKMHYTKLTKIYMI